MDAKEFIKEVVTKALGLLLTTGAFLGFVAVAGAALAWTRFYAVGLPPDRAVAAIPRHQQLVLGSGALILFIGLGALAVVVCWLLDPKALARHPMVHGLVAIAVVESATVIWIARPDKSWQRVVGAYVVVAVAAALVVLVSYREKVPDEQCPKVDDHPIYRLSRRGRKRMLALVAVLLIVVGVDLWEWWPPVAIGCAALLAVVDFWVADRTPTRFFPYAVAVFASVFAFGAAAGIVRFLGAPLVQPIALIRSVNGSRIAMQALYVTEDDKKLWLASVATVGCGREQLRRSSGRLFSVPMNQVVASQLGPMQRVKTAAVAAPRMAEQLAASRGLTGAGDRAALASAGTGGGDRAALASAGTAGGGRVAIDEAPAVRQEPEVTSVTPHQGPTGWFLDITGKGFGREDGVVRVGGATAPIVTWTNTYIHAEVPPKATTSRVEVDCPSFVDDRYRVERPPRPLPSVRPEAPGSMRYLLDATGSTDPDGHVTDYEWLIDDQPIGHGARLARALPPRAAPYRIELNVTDDDGVERHADVVVARLPSTVLFCTDCHMVTRLGRRVLARLYKYVRAGPVLRIDGYTDARGSDEYNMGLARARACAVRDALMTVSDGVVPRMVVRAFGERAPIATNATAAGRRANRRVEVIGGAAPGDVAPGPRGGAAAACG
jgi:outer membrane protein OmpA-like peptidoglycan-associated protein